MNSSNYCSIFASCLLSLLPVGWSQAVYSQPAIAASPSVPSAKLEKAWKLVQWERTNAPELSVGAAEITVEFREGAATGFGGCNNYNGSYQIADQKLTVGEVAATRKACRPAVSQREFLYFAALQGAQSFEITDAGKLRITYQSDRGSGVLVFEQSNPEATSGAWLDETTPNWNQADRGIPRAPIQAGDNLSNCTETFRTATLPEDKSVQIGGWTLSGSARVFGSTTVIGGMANADGQCRPLQFQYFVFKNGKFVGTLSPTVMDSRTDGSIFAVELFNESELRAEFNRYTESDALCCASGQSYLFYKIEETDRGFVLVPQLPASTNPISR